MKCYRARMLWGGRGASMCVCTVMCTYIQNSHVDGYISIHICI